MTQTHTHSRMIRHGLAMPTSRAFPLNWNPEPADFLDLEANVLEAAAYLIRKRDGALKANATLSGLTAYQPAGANGCVGSMGGDELERLVAELRLKANSERATASMRAERPGC